MSRIGRPRSDRTPRDREKRQAWVEGPRLDDARQHVARIPRRRNEGLRLGLMDSVLHFNGVLGLVGVIEPVGKEKVAT